ELVVAAYRHQHQLPLGEVDAGERSVGEIRLAGVGVETSLPGMVEEIKSSRMTDPFVEILKVGQGPLDEIADAVVVSGDPDEVETLPFPQGRLRETGHDHGLAQQ